MPKIVWEKNDQIMRMKRNLKTKDNQIPLLRVTSKDHKETEDKEKEPDLQPIMGEMVGPNLGILELWSIIVRKIADEADVGLVVKSTEELINKFEEFNESRFKNNMALKKLIIASMDIEKCYPSIKY